MYAKRVKNRLRYCDEPRKRLAGGSCCGFRYKMLRQTGLFRLELTQTLSHARHDNPKVGYRRVGAP